jgi:hypothetical protein
MQYWGNLFIFGKLENTKPPPPLSQVLLAFWPRERELCNRLQWKKEASWKASAGIH